MSLRDLYLFAFSLGVVLALFSFFNLLMLDFYSQILWCCVGILLVIVGAVLLGRQSKPQKRVTLGNAFYFFGMGIYIVLKGLAKDIGVAYRNSQERRRREEMLREHYRGIERENYAAGRGWARGMADVREEERIRRENERRRREAQRRFENQMFPKVNESLFDVPKVDEDFFFQDLYPKKRKKKRSIFDL